MSRLLVRVVVLGAFCVLLGSANAQDWQTATTLPGVDLTGLTAEQKASVLRVMRAQGCSCGCDMRMAECRVKDPKCAYSKGMSDVVIGAIKAGKSDQAAFDLAKDSRWGHVPEPKLLDDAVEIPVAGSPVLGPASAQVTIVEFSDFQCPYCVLAVPQIQAVLKAYPTQAKLIFKQFPLEIHTKAYMAAAAALAAQKQGKFWQMHDAMFEHHDDISKENLLKMASALGMNTDRFESDMDSAEVREAIDKDVSDGEKAGVQGTPSFFINGQHYNGPLTLTYLKPIFDSAIKNSQ